MFDLRPIYVSHLWSYYITSTLPLEWAVMGSYWGLGKRLINRPLEVGRRDWWLPSRGSIGDHVTVHLRLSSCDGRGDETHDPKTPRYHLTTVGLD